MGESDFKDFHCLIVDDDTSFLQLFEGMLRTLGIGKVSRGRSGSEALSFLGTSSRAVDVILCDLNMAAGNGLQLLKAVRTGQVKSFRPDACFIMMSANALPDPIKAAAALDANGYLVKPFSADKLKSAVVKGRNRHFAVDPVRYAQVAVPASAF